MEPAEPAVPISPECSPVLCTAPPVPSWISAALAVFRTTGFEPLKWRRGISLALLALIPVFLMIVGRLFGMERGRDSLFFITMLVPFYHYINLIVFVFLGCSALGESISDKTITYDLVCPVGRGAIYAGKYLAFLASTLVILLPVLILAYIVCMAPGGRGAFGGGDLFLRNLRLLWPVLLLTATGAMVYGAFFLLLSLVIRRAVLLAIILAVSIEGFIAYLPLKLSALSLHVHLRNLAGHLSGEPRLLEMIKGQTPIEIHPASSFAVLALLWLLFVVSGVMAIGRKQFV